MNLTQTYLRKLAQQYKPAMASGGKALPKGGSLTKEALIPELLIGAGIPLAALGIRRGYQHLVNKMKHPFRPHYQPGETGAIKIESPNRATPVKKSLSDPEVALKRFGNPELVRKFIESGGTIPNIAKPIVATKAMPAIKAPQVAKAPQDRISRLFEGPGQVGWDLSWTKKSSANDVVKAARAHFFTLPKIAQTDYMADMTLDPYYLSPEAASLLNIGGTIPHPNPPQPTLGIDEPLPQTPPQ